MHEKSLAFLLSILKALKNAAALVVLSVQGF